MMAELIENGTRLMMGQVQVHSAEYRPERNMHHTIGGYDGIDLEAFLARIESHPDVTAAAPRLYGGGLLSSGDETKAGLLFGIDPEREQRVGTLLSRLSDGRLPEPGAYEILVGVEMARQLELEIGAEVVVVAPASDGSMGNDLFTLVGVFETGTPAIDANYAILPLPDLQYLMAMDPGRVHEIALTVTRAWDTPLIASSLAASLEDSGHAVEVTPWTELRPELAEMIDLMDAVNYLIAAIIFAMAIFGVANTMLIGTFERRREFAVVRALGTSPLGIGRTVVYEGIILGAISLVAGALITWPIVVWWHNSPPDLTSVIGGFSLAGSQWRPILRIEYSYDTPVICAVALFLTAVFAAVYPAWKATRVPPADALADR
jgi:ABC-type lipoprotein release transport system permease subunit